MELEGDGYTPPLEVGDVLSSCGAMFCGTRSRGEYGIFYL